MDAARLHALLDAYLDHALLPPQQAELEQALVASAEARQIFWEHVQLHAQLRDLLADTADHGQTASPTAGAHVVATAAPPRRAARWLALAAGLALAVGGGWWFYPRLAGAPALGLRLVEMQGAVAVTRAGQSLAAVPGMVLQAGDQVAAKEGSQATLKYAAEETTIKLHSAAASFGTEKGAKRVKLHSGLLRCTAAPQRRPFRIETTHAVAEVVGTRFWLAAAATETTLAVQEGKVALWQKDKSLEVNAGETAVADAAGLRKPSPSDAWLNELLARAEAAPWAALDLARGEIIGDPGVWRADRRGEPAGRRVWQTDTQATSIVLFDAARWKRGVVVGRVMILPAGELPAALAVPEPAPNAGWTTAAVGLNLEFGRGLPNGVGLVLHKDFRIESKGAFGALGILTADRHSRGVWYRFALYFDTEAAGGPVALYTSWPADRTGPPPAGDWNRAGKALAALSGQAVGVALRTQGVPALWEGLKLVTLGPDLPPPPGLPAEE